MSTGRKVYLSEEASFRSGKPKSMFDSLDSELAGEGNGQVAVEGSSDGNPYNEIIHQTDM
jgi:hypothetical protein